MFKLRNKTAQLSALALTSLATLPAMAADPGLPAEQAKRAVQQQIDDKIRELDEAGFQRAVELIDANLQSSEVVASNHTFNSFIEPPQGDMKA